MKIKKNPSPEKSINLFHCLNELGDHSLMNKIQQYVRSGGLSSARLSASQWSAVVFVLLTSEYLDKFKLKIYISISQGQNHMSPDEVLQKLLPVVEASRLAQLSHCNITAEGCAALASALRSNSQLRVLDLTENNIGDKSLTLLSDGLKDPHCKLEKLWLFDCYITAEGCAALTSALRSNSHLRELNLSENEIGDKGLMLLSDGLKDHCKLEKLMLRYCDITAEGCAALASALRSNSHLRELDLTGNKIGGQGLTLLSDGLEDSHCKLEKLWLYDCYITAEGCAALASALRSNSHLRELNLSKNNIGDKGLKLLSDGQKDPQCKLEKLNLSYCNITAEGCAALTSALRSNSHLREMNLSGNKIGGAGLMLLSDGLKDPHCKLEKLWLFYCDITAEGCAALASALRSNSYLRVLVLSRNNLEHASVKHLSALKDNPHSKLETLFY
ncbi:ribonuclease inhibitor-like isoform X1 [Megalobrama amblycephala]|uniref:ribonuclease inhibitor-like isoform X1 n=1 Tax=Megalobrama amblycephala TaxID=75352 RepID=UPI002013CCA8|nr:ribonuclease inhibitor-like isoform X1 [Megalobrama amblycephala]